MQLNMFDTPTNGVILVCLKRNRPSFHVMARMKENLGNKKMDVLYFMNEAHFTIIS